MNLQRVKTDLFLSNFLFEEEFLQIYMILVCF